MSVKLVNRYQDIKHDINYDFVMSYDEKCQLPMFFLSSQIRRHRRSLFDQIDPGITVSGNRSRVFQKNLIAARTASR